MLPSAWAARDLDYIFTVCMIMLRATLHTLSLNGWCRECCPVFYVAATICMQTLRTGGKENLKKFHQQR